MKIEKNVLSNFLVVFLFLFVIFPHVVSASTIWCNPANSGSEDGLNKSTGYKTLWAAISQMSSGDTLVIANGDWTTYPKMSIDNNQVPPSGTKGGYTKIKAETEWEVRLPYLWGSAGSYTLK